jgi:hypothetical protein
MSPDWIQMNIPGKFQGIGISFDENSSIPSLEKMAGSSGFTVKIVSVACINMMQNGAQVSSWGFGGEGDSDWEGGKNSE